MSYDANRPLVSCIMPSRDRRPFIAQAIRYFQRQSYPYKELIVVDDGSDAIGDLVPTHDGMISYLRLDQACSIGWKRNLAIERARGSVVIRWDDDDWYGAGRIAYQVERLLAERADICGLKMECVVDIMADEFWSCSATLHARMFYGDLHGGTLAYLRQVWERGPRFPDSSLAEDAAFLRSAGHRARVRALPNAETFMYVRHGANAWAFTCGEHVDRRGWARVPAPAYVGATDLAFYRALATGLAQSSEHCKRQGDTHRLSGRYHDALDWYARAIEIDADNVWAWFDRSQCLERLGAFDEALRTALEADRLLHPHDGNRTWVHSQLGLIYLRLGRHTSAREQFGLALELHPRNHVAISGLAECARYHA